MFPIEQMWAIGKGDVTRVDFTMAKTQREKVDLLWRTVHDSFFAVPNDVVSKLCIDFERRLKLVLNVGGNTISNLLSSHVSRPRPQGIRKCTMRDFSMQEDSLILREGAAHRWTALLRDHPWPRGMTTRILKWRYENRSHDQAIIANIALRSFNSKRGAGFGDALLALPGEEEEEELA
jgi:hypothetical protein